MTPCSCHSCYNQGQYALSPQRLHAPTSPVSSAGFHAVASIFAPHCPAARHGCVATNGLDGAYQGLRIRQRPAGRPTESASVKNLILIGAALFAAAPALAQGTLPRQSGTTGTVIQSEPNSTGGDSNIAVSRGATGADTVTTNSAAGGNSSKPEQALPNSSAGGGGR